MKNEIPNNLEAVRSIVGGKHGAGRPMWFVILERFGFPTLVALALGYFLYVSHEEDRADRKAEAVARATEHSEWKEAVEQNTHAVMSIDKHLVQHMVDDEAKEARLAAKKEGR